MTVERYPDLFNDVFGPIMQPGSSSHTAGPCRLGYLAHSLLGERPAKIQVLLDREGSFAGTFGLMTEDSAMLAGAMGIRPDDVRLFDAPKIADAAGIAYSFEFTTLDESARANAVKFVLTGPSGQVVTLVGDSTGGGMVETRIIDGYPLRVKGDTYVLLLFDTQACLTAAQAEALQTRLPALVDAGTRPGADGSTLYYYETAGPPDLDAIRSLYPDVRLACLRPVLPVLTRPDRKPQLFDTMTRWREIAQERDMPLWEVAVQYERDASGWTRAQVIDYMWRVAAKMHRQTHAPYEEDIAVPPSPFRADMVGEWKKHMHSSRRLTDDLTANAIKWAYGAGAGLPGVETVAGPMGSGGGYVYAALCAVKDAHRLSDDDLLRGLFIAAGIGAIAFTRTEPTGECIGCTGECGICGAMAAAGIVEMTSGTPAQVENAASLSLQSAIGLPCDPIPGGFGQPCRSRIIAAVCTAPVFADLALCGRDAVLPLHEAIDVADAVGRQLSSDLLCTSRGGACATPTARRRAAAFRAWFDQSQAEGTPRPPGNLI